MQRYSDTNRCPKCNQVATTRWLKNSKRMRRQCVRCGFEWDEAPLDAVDDAKHFERFHGPKESK